jgi:Mg2+ and Co2+ transporter CorA
MLEISAQAQQQLRESIADMRTESLQEITDFYVKVIESQTQHLREIERAGVQTQTRAQYEKLTEGKETYEHLLSLALQELVRRKTAGVLPFTECSEEPTRQGQVHG